MPWECRRYLRFIIVAASGSLREMIRGPRHAVSYVTRRFFLTFSE
jgi:hypothetical protein